MNYSPASNISNIFINLEKRYKTCFLWGLVAGICAHFTAMAHLLYNADTLSYTPIGYGTGIRQGRWALTSTCEVLKALFSNIYTLPFFNVLLCILMLSFAACLCVDIFEVKENLHAGLIGALFTIYPSIVSEIYFLYLAPYHVLGLMLSVLSAYILIKPKKKNFFVVILSIAVLTYGTGIYQTCFTPAVTVTVSYLIIRHLRSAIKGEELDFKKELLSSFSYLCYLGISMIAYFICSKLALFVTKTEMMSHKGLDSMGQMSLFELVRGIARSYKSYFYQLYINHYELNPTYFVRLAILIIGIITPITALVIVLKSKNKPLVKALSAVLILIFPMSVNLTQIMVANAGLIYTMMMFSNVFIFVTPIKLVELINEDYKTPEFTDFSSFVKSLNFKNALNYLCILMAFVTVTVFIWFDNGNYQALKYTNEHDLAFYQTMMTQIKSLDEFNEDLPFLIVGTPDDKTNSKGSMIGNCFNINGRTETNANQYSSLRILTERLGLSLEQLNSDEDEQRIMNNPLVNEMPCYPNAGAIKIVDGVIVIKFS